MAGIHSLTVEAKGLANVIVSPIIIKPHKQPQEIKSLGIWDTGATGSTITQHYAKQLGLLPIGRRFVRGVSGIKEVNEYLIDVTILQRVTFQGVRVTECDDLTGNNEAAMLIGMDIITTGDFAISNFKGKTTMSFRVPSQEKINFIPQKKTLPGRREKKTGRNDPCPCGSGKKYKNCHGKN